MTGDRHHITILMGTRNGARFLPEQLASLQHQSHRDWSLWVSDDGSSDTTRTILETFRKDAPEGRVRIFEGPRQGGARNFLSLACHPDLPPGHVALADQDDVWLKGKLARALRLMDGKAGPVLYGAQSILVTQTLQRVTATSDPGLPSFGNALVQNLFGGHSIVLNPDALALVRQAGVPRDIEFHDWWLYLLLSGCGAQCLLDPRPVLLYRQHEANALGASRGLRAGLRRISLVLGRDYGRWVATNLAALEESADLLTPDARSLLACLRGSGTRRGPGRAVLLHRLGVRRQTRLGTGCLYLAAATGRV